VHRQPELAAGPVPQRLLDDRDRAVGERAGAAALAVRERASRSRSNADCPTRSLRTKPSIMKDRILGRTE
jgi:hypothetical protein